MASAPVSGRSLALATVATNAIDVIHGLAKLARDHGIALASHDDDSIEKVNFLKDLGAAVCEFPITLKAATEARRLGMATALVAPNALRDPLFVDKVQDIVGLYMSPPDRVVVLCVDEKSQIRALDREQPVLPMAPGVAPIPMSATARHPCSPRSTLRLAR